MNIFQFDECSDGKSLIRSCKTEALSQVRRYPTKHKNLPDPEMLAIYMKKDGTLVTFDRRIVEENLDAIPGEHPGLIMVGHSPAIPYTMTEESASKILRALKDGFADWHTISWKNSIVTITDASIEVSRRTGAGVQSMLYASFENDNWQHLLKDCLLQNSTK